MFYISALTFLISSSSILGGNRRLCSGRMWSTSKVQQNTQDSERERERDFVRNDERDLWSSSLSPGGWLSIVRRRKRAASAQGCGKERRHSRHWATDRADQARPRHTGGYGWERHKRRWRNLWSTSLDSRTPIWEQLQAENKSFTRHCKLTLDLRKPNRNLKTNGALIIEKLFPTMQCTWPEPPFPTTHKVVIFISFLFSFCLSQDKGDPSQLETQCEHTVYELMNNTELPLTFINTDSMHYVPHQWCKNTGVCSITVRFQQSFCPKLLRALNPEVFLSGWAPGPDW